MDDAQPRSFFRIAFDAGYAAFNLGIPRDQFPLEFASTEVMFWHSGWDTGLCEEAGTLGAFADFTDANPYPPASEAAACWAKGWRLTHKLTALSG